MGSTRPDCVSRRRTVTVAAARLWRRIGGPAQWRILLLTNAKYGAGVAGMIRDDSGRILLLRHRFHQTDDWALPGGGCAAWSGSRTASLGRSSRKRDTPPAIDRLVRLTGVRRLDLAEVLAAGFFDPDALPDDILPVHRELIAAALADCPSQRE